jgi:ribonuclease E
VRQAGAAGAKLPVTVDETKSAAKASETSTSTPEPDAAADSQQKPARTRQRRRTSAATPATPRRSRSRTATGSAPSAEVSERQRRVKSLANELFSDPGVISGKAAKVTAEATSDQGSQEHRNRPMTSLLFQEPVLPTEKAGKTDRRSPQESAQDSVEESRQESSTRTGEGSGEADEETTQTSRPTRKRRQSRGRNQQEREQNSRNGSSEETEETTSNDEESSPRRRGRNRRLNAQERRAAAEVEQIEEDMTYDKVAFTAVEDDEQESDSESGKRGRRNSSDEDSDERGNTRRRRRRRRGGRDEESDEESSSRSERSNDSRSDDEDEDEGSGTRRRRRRRKSEDESSSSSSSRRSRKQQYIDEITDIEGSTRLEAKRQRRRDNRRDRSRQSLITEQDFLARRENVDRQMVVREKDRHTQISVIEDDILVEHYVSDIQEVSTVGNIYLGRVQNVLPSMEAAFVDIGKPRNGVLYAGEVNWDSARLEGHPRRIELAYHSGDPVLVQVTKDPIGHKGARLTSQVTLAGRFIVLVPSGAMTGVSRKLPERERTRLKKIVQAIAPKDMGIIIRTAAEGASEEAITKDCENLVRQWDSITEKIEQYKDAHKPKLLKGEPDVAIRVVRDIFNDDFRTLAVQGDGVYERIKDYLEQMAPDLLDKLSKWDPADHQGKDVFDQWQIDGQLRKGMERQVYLPSGGSLVIDRTEAMTTIDVNTGRFIGKGKSLEETVTRCNLEAAEEIVRQLRLRDIGGMVMIDFVDMVLEANRDLVLRRLVECLARDRTKHQVAEVTSLGLVQMTRKRVGQGLVEAFSEECPTCHGRGFILHDEPTVSATSDDPYAVKGGDPFIEGGKKHRHSSSNSSNSSKSSNSHSSEKHESRSSRDESEHEDNKSDNAPQGSTAEVKAKLAAIAAAASRHEEEALEEQGEEK